ncbi:MAG: pentapeptide repeat-containing protein [Pseudonocardiaceae bacterium]
MHLLTEKVLSETGRGLNLTQADLSGLDLSGFDLRHAVLNRASLYGTQLAKANLTGASLVCAGMERTDFTEAVVTGAYVHAFAAQASTFTGADMTGLVDSTGALFHGCDLAGARLDDAELAGTTFYQCNLVETRFQGTDLHGAVFNECRMDYAILGRAYLHDAMILRSSIRELNLSHARGHGLVLRRPTAADGLCLTNAHLPGLRLDQVRARRLRAADLHAPGIDVLDCQLPEADFSHADLSGGRWAQVGLDGARLVGALLPDSSWRGVSAINADATQVTAEGLTAGECTFTDAVFIGLAGRYSTFRNCDFHCADLRSAYLYRATFVGDPPTSACLVGAQLDGANLTQAYLAADFTGASIRHGWAAYARVNQAIFERADLRGTSLFRASAVKTEFTGARLGGQYGVVFADRCPGLLDALHESADPASKRVAELVEELSELLTRDAGMST